MNADFPSPMYFALLFWIIPFVMVLFSKRVRGREKVGWLLSIVFISWFAGVLFLLLAPLKNTDS